MQAATSRFSAVLSVKETEFIRAAEDGSPRATSFATTFGRFAPLESRINTGDSVKSETAADNKRHTNAHRPLTSHSPTGSTIPPPPLSHDNSSILSPVAWRTGNRFCAAGFQYIFVPRVPARGNLRKRTALGFDASKPSQIAARKCLTESAPSPGRIRAGRHRKMREFM